MTWYEFEMCPSHMLWYCFSGLNVFNIILYCYDVILQTKNIKGKVVCFDLSIY